MRQKAAERPRKIPKLELLAVDEYLEREISAIQSDHNGDSPNDKIAKLLSATPGGAVL